MLPVYKIPFPQPAAIEHRIRSFKTDQVRCNLWHSKDDARSRYALPIRSEHGGVGQYGVVGLWPLKAAASVGAVRMLEGTG